MRMSLLVQLTWASQAIHSLDGLDKMDDQVTADCMRVGLDISPLQTGKLASACCCPPDQQCQGNRSEESADQYSRNGGNEGGCVGGGGSKCRQKLSNQRHAEAGWHEGWRSAAHYCCTSRHHSWSVASLTLNALNPAQFCSYCECVFAVSAVPLQCYALSPLPENLMRH